MLKGNDHFKKLNDFLSTKICAILKDRIFFLESQGLLGLWTKSSGNHIFNGGTLFGYLDDEWE